ncbi:MAG: hypothetical protein U0Q18_10305 [Bryobacteraceae bacterium]
MSRVSLLLTAICVLAGSVTATSVPRVSLQELTTTSGMIVHGRVESQSCGWDPEHRFIWTHTRIRIQDVVKGGPFTTVTVSEPGGTADGLIMEVPGAVRFTSGEEIVLFLRDTPLHYWRVRGWTQGKFHFGSPAEFTAFKSRVRRLLR